MAQLHGLYAITDEHLIPAGELIAATEQAIDGGARVIQYRNKQSDATLRKQQASQLAELCKTQNVLFIVNDDIELAKAVAADGVHLGKDDGNIEYARQQLGNRIIGVSCYNEWQRAVDAQNSGADYVAFGAFFVSSTKPGAPRATQDMLAKGKNELEIPVTAIGGITPDNGGTLVAAGADMLAVINGVFGQKEICAAASRYAQLFK